METNDLISIQLFCAHYRISTSFIEALNEYELVEIVTIQETPCINKSQIREIEKMIHFHDELDINIEGIEVIYNLLRQIKTLQKESVLLRNRLEIYEDI